MIPTSVCLLGTTAGVIRVNALYISLFMSETEKQHNDALASEIKMNTKIIYFLYYFIIFEQLKNARS